METDTTLYWCLKKKNQLIPFVFFPFIQNDITENNYQIVLQFKQSQTLSHCAIPVYWNNDLTHKELCICIYVCICVHAVQ